MFYEHRWTTLTAGAGTCSSVVVNILTVSDASLTAMRKGARLSNYDTTANILKQSTRKVSHQHKQQWHHLYFYTPH